SSVRLGQNYNSAITPRERGKHFRRSICRPVINHDDAKARECLPLKAFYRLCYRRCAIEYWQQDVHNVLVHRYDSTLAGTVRPAQQTVGIICFARPRSISVFRKGGGPLKRRDNCLIQVELRKHTCEHYTESPFRHARGRRRRANLSAACAALELSGRRRRD